MKLAIPKMQRAIIQTGEPGRLQLVTDRPVPALGANQVRVKIAAVALNPSDWKMPTNFPCPGAGAGSDYAGTIVEMGCDVHATVRSDVQVGDRVAGAVHSANVLDKDAGAFAEYVSVCADQLWKVPATMSFSDAAAIGWSVLGTVGLALFHDLNLPGTLETPLPPSEKIPPPWVLVYGGSTASGTMATQILARSGYRVVTTCSPRHFPLARSYGATAVLDHASSTCASDVRTLTSGNLRYAVDIVSDARSLGVCYSSLGRAGGKYVAFDLVPDELLASAGRSATVKPSRVLGITMAGGDVSLGDECSMEADQNLRRWGCELLGRMQEAISKGLIRPHPVEVDSTGGLAAVIPGVDRLRRREVSGFKLVYVVA